jgi:hypothetical protein
VTPTLTAKDANAIAALGPQSDVVELIRLYQQVGSEVGSIFYDERFDPETFEDAILKREDQYLDLLLSKAVRELRSAEELWARAASSEANASYSGAVKENLVHAIGAELLMGGYRVTEFTSAGKEVFPNLEDLTDLGYVAFKSPKNRSLIRAFVSSAYSGSEEPLFANCSDRFKAFVWQAIARNDTLNIDDSDFDGPDFTFFDIQNGVMAFLQTSPVDRLHLRVLHDLIENLNPQVHRFSHDFQAEKFISKWSQFEGVDQDEVEKMKGFEGYYTSFQLADEMLALFVSKFKLNLSCKVTYKSLDEAQDSDDLIGKATYFGSVNPLALAKALKNGYVGSDCTLLALQNTAIYDVDVHLEKIEACIREYPEDSDIVRIFNRQKKLFSNKDLRSSHADMSRSNIKEDFDTVIGLLSKIRSDIDRAKEGWEEAKQSLSVLKWWLLIFAVVYLANKWW